MAMILSYKDKYPKIAEGVYIADNAVIIGDVEIKEGASVWFGAVIRADNDQIIIGKNTNIQDNCTLHNDAGSPLIIGDNVTVGHNVVLHGCTIDDSVLIGMNSTILNGAHIRSKSLVAAGSMVKGNSDFPEGSMIVGAPATVKCPVKSGITEMIDFSVQEYIDFSKVYGDQK